MIKKEFYIKKIIKKINIKYIKRSDQQSFITISFPSFKYSSKNTYITSLISELLTGYIVLNYMLY